MSNKFVQAFSNITRTENGDLTYKSSENPVLDFFFLAGRLRGISDSQLESILMAAWNYNPNLTIKAIFYFRDILQGLGERKTFRRCIRLLAQNYPNSIKHLVKYVPEYGRWDDLFALFDTPLENAVLETLKEGLNTNALCAKWMPREGKKGYKEYGNKLRHYLNLSRKAYRKLLSSKTKVVETEMCFNRWDNIKYSAVPSVAISKYNKAFIRHDGERFKKYLEDVKSGKSKINAKAIFPHDIVKKVLDDKNSVEYANVHWEHLPDFVGDTSFLPICDVSGSMFVASNNVVPITISIGLGIYLSQRNKSVFKDLVMTFSANPSFVRLTGDLKSRIEQLKKIDWGANTDIVKALRLMLKLALHNGVPDSDMPKNLIIISDMQFDASRNYFNSIEEIKHLYKQSGYTFPNIYFWNVGAYGTFPVKFLDNNFAMISGYSPSIMRNILTGDITPEKIMLNTLNSSRYEKIYVLDRR